MKTGSILPVLKTKKGKKTLKILACILIVPVMLILFISPIAKYLIEKYDVEYTGREITVDRPYVNIFTGYVSFNNLKISESDPDSLFLKANCISANFSVYKLFFKTIEVSELTLVDPVGTLIQNKKEINIGDIIRRFSPKQSAHKNKAPLKFNILHIKIDNGEIHYREVITPVHIFIAKLNMECSGIRWNSDTIASTYTFLSGIGKGGMNGHFSINTKNMDYKIVTKIDSLDLNFINQYTKDLANYGEFKATLDARVNAKGNFKNAQILSANGTICLSDFHSEDQKGEDCVSFEKLSVGIIGLDPKEHLYCFDSVLLVRPYLKYEQYDDQTNIQAMYYKKKEGGYVSKNPGRFNLIVAIGDYLKVISKNFFKSYYQVNQLAVTDGRLLYNNYSLNEKFSIATDPLSLSADSIDKTKKMVELQFKTQVKPYGNVKMSLNINPMDSSDFDLTYHVKELPLAMFNPYLISYTSFPVDRGTIEVKGKWTVRNGNIKSANHLIIIDPRLSKRIRHKRSKWIPMPFVMAFVRERGNVIDYEVPISGNMKDPHFNFEDVIFDLIKNIFIKPPTTPYEYTVKNIENQIERVHSLKWTTGQCTLENDQEKFVSSAAGYLNDNPGARLSIFPMEYSEKEREYILFFLAKKKYYLSCKKDKVFDEGDSLTVDKMSIKDPLFRKYMVTYCKNPMLFTVHEKCVQYVGQALVEKKLGQLREQRKEAFLYYFKENGTNARVTIHPVENKIPYNGFSFFKILYDKGIPSSLNEIYQRMEDLNTKSPRKRYQTARSKNKNS
jgi:hypothetical protein